MQNGLGDLRGVGDGVVLAVRAARVLLDCRRLLPGRLERDTNATVMGRGNDGAALRLPSAFYAM